MPKYICQSCGYQYTAKASAQCSLCGKGAILEVSERTERIDFDYNDELKTAEDNAWYALSHNNFQQFGYWAEIWMQINRISKKKKANPFYEILAVASYKTRYRNYPNK
ncbi:hypothetical protein [Sporobacter termitidis]|uniref:hypothetical protein n=1 Tax=Sporobacter termitidis TaxID=44749 RepID=UPI001160AA81|nr:hypothetical protein [Sporobacter termitidis]